MRVHGFQNPNLPYAKATKVRVPMNGRQIESSRVLINAIDIEVSPYCLVSFENSQEIRRLIYPNFFFARRKMLSPGVVLSGEKPCTRVLF